MSQKILHYVLHKEIDYISSIFFDIINYELGVILFALKIQAQKFLYN